MAKSVAFLGMVLLIAAGTRAHAQVPARKTVEELEQEVAKLKEQVKQLADQLEGTAKPINLGRTSVAMVAASSVNGGRDLANSFYGIRNAFDAGVNWVNGINYTYWLTNGEQGPWVELRFDVPVTVAGIHIEGGPRFTTQFFMKKGGEDVRDEAQETLRLEKPVAGVTRVRLTFQGNGNVQVNEIRVMGFLPAGTKYEVGRPRIFMDQQNAQAVANAAFEDWKASLFRVVGSTCQEGGKQFVVTFHQNGRDLCRVTLSRQTDQVTLDPFVHLAPVDKGQKVERK